MYWQALLENPMSQGHFVQLYKTDEELLAPVGHYVIKGLERKEAVVLVVTPSHRNSLANAITQIGFDVGSLSASGQLVLLDAAETLSAFSVDGIPVREKFFEVIEPVIEKAARDFGAVRAFGEMVNLLWENKKLPVAIELEKFWHELLTKRPFSLLCAYVMDHLGVDSHAGPLQQVCSTHSHLIPTTDYERLEKAVSLAIDGVLGPSQANMLRSLVLAQRRRALSTDMPVAQSVLIWLKENMPVMADKVLLRAKSAYETRSEGAQYVAH